MGHGGPCEAQSPASTSPASIGRWPAASSSACGRDRRLVCRAAALGRWQRLSSLLWIAAPAIARWTSLLSACGRPSAGIGIRRARLAIGRAPHLALSSRPLSRQRTTCCRPTISRRTRNRSSRAGPLRPIFGLYLLSAVSARDFGWVGTTETVERLEATLAAMASLQRFRGHFYNWYDTSDLRPLDPRYVSTVDSGNLAGHLIAVANACREWIDRPLAPPRLSRRHRRRLAPGARGHSRASRQPPNGIHHAART